MVNEATNDLFKKILTYNSHDFVRGHYKWLSEDTLRPWIANDRVSKNLETLQQAIQRTDVSGALRGNSQEDLARSKSDAFRRFAGQLNGYFSTPKSSDPSLTPYFEELLNTGTASFKNSKLVEGWVAKNQPIQQVVEKFKASGNLIFFPHGAGFLGLVLVIALIARRSRHDRHKQKLKAKA